MKQLTCELCDGTSFLKEDGFFVCQGCGTKYSVAEAKQLMKDDGIPAPVSSVPAAPVVNNNSAVTANYLTMAESALDSNNNAEAENYANKVLELDPVNSKAWEIKGKAAGWQSKTINNRIPEAVNAFMFAVEYAAEEDKADMRVRVGNAYTALAKAMMNLHCENFGKLPDTDHAEKIFTNLKNTISMMNDLVAKSSVGFNRAPVYNELARTMNNAACDGFKEAKSDFGPEHRNMAKWQWERFTGRCDACLTVLDKALTLVREPALAIQICDNYKTIGETARDSCSWTFNVNSWNADNYDRDFSFTDGAKKARTDAINNFMKNKTDFNAKPLASVLNLLSSDRAASEAIAAREKYWEEHPEEKTRLDNEKADRQNQMDDMAKQIAEISEEIKTLRSKLNAPVPTMAKKTEVMRSISQLEVDLAGLGMFKGKEKKALREQIDSLRAGLPQLDASIKQELDAQNAPIQEQIDSLTNQLQTLNTKRQELHQEIEEVDKELFKPRGKLDTAGMFELKDAVTDGKFTVTYTEFLEHMKRITPAPYQYSDFTIDNPNLSNNLKGCRKSIITNTSLPGKNKNTGCLLYFELEPGTDIIKTILLTGPRDNTAKSMHPWCLIGSLILLALSPETSRENAEKIFANMAFSETSSWYGENEISFEYADFTLIEIGTVALRSSCAVIRPNC